jgi:hypothetical protein
LRCNSDDGRLCAGLCGANGTGPQRKRGFLELDVGVGLVVCVRRGERRCLLPCPCLLSVCLCCLAQLATPVGCPVMTVHTAQWGMSPSERTGTANANSWQEWRGNSGLWVVELCCMCKAASCLALRCLFLTALPSALISLFAQLTERRLHSQRLAF